MFRYGLLSFFAGILSFMVLRFDEDEGGGADDIGDIEIDVDADEGGGDTSDTVTVPKQEYEQNTAAVNQLMQEKLYNDTIGRIKTSIPDFDADRVVSRLKEMAKTDPARAAQYNNEIGFQLLWKQEFEGKTVENDPHNDGSNGGSDVDMDDLRSKAGNGNTKAFDALLDAAKA